MSTLASLNREPVWLLRRCRPPFRKCPQAVVALLIVAWSINELVAEPPTTFPARFEVASAMAIQPLETRQLVSSFVGGPEIACRAARRWLPSQLLRQRANTTIDAYRDQDDCLRQVAITQATFLQLQACAQEDVAAALALRAYYSRIGVDQQLELINETENLLREQQLALQALVDKGIGSVDNDPSELSRRMLELADQRIVANSSGAQLCSALCQLTGEDSDLARSIGEPLEVRPQTLDCEGLCSFALVHRHDLHAWSYLSSRINDASAEMIANSIAPLLGGIDLSLPQICVLDLLLKRSSDNCLRCNIATEVATAYQLQRDQVEKSVRNKCLTLLSAYERAALSDQIVTSLEERIHRLERLAELGDSQPVKLFEARIQLSHAKSNALQRQIEAKLAEVDLSESVGGLARRCCAGTPWLVIGNSD